MKKTHIITSIVSGMLILSCFLFFSIKYSNKLELTKEEKEFINQNQNEYFFMGYYVTPSEKLVMDKLCRKLSEDTGLKIVPFQGTWDENIKLLQMGKIPMLANMNITEDRLEYSYFTSPLADLSIGVYSNYDNKIEKYEDLEGKTIGIEKNAVLLEAFKKKYPQIKFNERNYNSLDSLRDALSNGEIDGFFSSNSYNEDLYFYYFFKVETISRDNNYIGVNKNYPILYSIVNKEVEHLINIDWYKEIEDIVNFEIESKFMELTDEEKKYLKRPKSICIGIPKEFSYYAYGDPYNPKGIIPSFFNKIEFITDLDFIYYFDSYDNLLRQNDIDMIVSSKDFNLPSTSPIFFDKLIAVSREKVDAIGEIYELEPYAVGMINDTVLINNLKRIMPHIIIKIYKTYDELYQNLEMEKVDYAIIPERLYENKASKSNLVNSGEIYTRFHYVYSKNNDKLLLSIINKCMTRINVDILVNEEIFDLIQDEEPTYEGILSILIVVFIIGTIGYQIFRRYKKYNRQLYFDEETMIQNECWLKNKLKINYSQHVYFLVEPQNLNLIMEQYGINAYEKSLKVLVNTIKDNTEKNEYIIKLSSNRFLIIKKDFDEKDRISYLHKLKILFHRKFTICDINFSYVMNVVSLQPQDKIYTYEALVKELDIGMRYAEYSGDVVDYTPDVDSAIRNKIEYDTKLSSVIMNEEINLKFNQILDHQGQLYGYDITYSCMLEEWGKVNFVNLRRNVKRLGLETTIDKVVLKKLFKSLNDSSSADTRVFIEVNKKTLENTNLFSWMIEKLESLNNIQLFIKIDIDSYEKLLDNMVDINHNQLNFVLEDFQENILQNTIIKEYDIPVVAVSASVFLDIECHEEIINFIISFSKKYHKKILITAIKTVHLYRAIQDYDIDYYVNDFRGEENESINR